ncbi:MAG: hypothetical protein KTR33_10380 [Gammaproteobacteria bacterium]|nr:hypothetical protein [Gammaproteobacteria bacterium]
MALSIPSRKQPGPESFPTQPDDVRDWLTTLHPLGSTDNCRALHRGLKHSNRLETENGNRAAIASLFEPAIEEAVSTLQAEFLDQSQPLPPKAEQYRQLALDVLSEQTFQYKIIVHDTYASLTERQPQFRNQGIFKALRSLASLIECHLVSQSEPDPVLMHDANTLFDLAEKGGIHRSAIATEEGDSANEWTIEHAFIYVQLLAMSQPWNQRQRQIPALINFLQQRVTSLSITSYDAAREHSTDSVFGIQLTQIGHPQPLKHTPRQPVESLRLLDIGPLLAGISEAHKRTPDSINNFFEIDGLTRSGLNLLREALDRKNQRKYARAITRKSVHSEIGLRHITAAVRFASETGGDLGTPELAAATNYWPQTPIHRQRRWVVTNENRFGACLEWLDNEPTDAAVGEVIALKRNNRDAEPSWVTGIVRWLKSIAPDRLQVGIEFLAGNTTATRILHTVDELTTRHEGVCANLLPGVLPDHSREVLITPPTLFRHGDEVSADQKPLVLGEKILATSGFDMFGYEERALEQSDTDQQPDASAG